ncbi:MAG: F0F1 ATP synthase subunit A [Thermodesulfobacteriota bacterium]
MHDILLPTFGLPVHTALMLYVMALLCVFSYLLRGSLKLVPGKLQNTVEIVVEGFAGLIDEVMGQKGKFFLPAILTFFVFILISNTLGMIPGLAPPTANLNTTVGLALIVFVATHIVGLKEHGIGYVKHFTGPIWWMVPFMFPIEVFGHLARPLSLSFRLFGNMFGHEQLIVVLLMLMPYAYPMVLFSTILGVLAVILQAFIFSLLAMAYIGGALEEAH